MNKGLRSFFVIVASLLVATSMSRAQQSSPNPKFDADLAKRLGADEYGMRQYVMAFLRKGPNRGQDSTTAATLQAAHMNNISRMAKEGTLVLAGPFMDDGNVQGIYLFNVKTVDEARRLTETDPAVKAGRLVMELHPWYGSAALMDVVRVHATLQKRNVTE